MNSSGLSRLLVVELSAGQYYRAQELWSPLSLQVELEESLS